MVTSIKSFWRPRTSLLVEKLLDVAHRSFYKYFDFFVSCRSVYKSLVLKRNLVHQVAGSHNAYNAKNLRHKSNQAAKKGVEGCYNFPEWSDSAHKEIKDFL